MLTNKQEFAGWRVDRVRSVGFNRFIEASGVGSWDLLKMNCKGAEHDIITSLNKDNLRKIERISMQMHKGCNEKKLIDFLESASFKIVFRFREDYRTEIVKLAK